MFVALLITAGFALILGVALWVERWYNKKERKKLAGEYPRKY